MRRILLYLGSGWHFVAILAACLSVASIFVLWVLTWETLEPQVTVGEPVILRPCAPDAGMMPDHPVVPEEDDGFQVFKIRDDVDAKLPKGVRTTAGQTVVVRVEEEEGDSAWYGSGFVLRKGLVVSAAHIFDHVDKPYAPIVHCSDEDVDGKVLAIDRGRDIVLIAADCPGVTRPLDLKPLKAGEKVYLTGYTYSFPGDGDVTADRYVNTASPVPAARLGDLPARSLSKDISVQLIEMKKRNLARHKAVTGVAIPGHSGSAVARPNGAIVGVVVIRDPARGHSYVIPARHIRQLMKKYGIK